MKTIYTLTAMFATLAAVLAFYLGYQWQHEGTGLNPLAAYPLGTIMLILPFVARGDS